VAGRDPLERPDELLRRVYAYVAYRVTNRTEAEDITSETFERAVRYRHTFDRRKGEPIAWLLGIARNCVSESLARPRTQALDTEPIALRDFESEVATRMMLAQALASLSASDRELIALRYGADLTGREIARELEMRLNAVEVALTRARGRLAAALEAAAGPEPASMRKVAEERL
jgi:RNA polymerase sigma-70 factor (ECF subfamily)